MLYSPAFTQPFPKAITLAEVLLSIIISYSEIIYKPPDHANRIILYGLK